MFDASWQLQVGQYPNLDIQSRLRDCTVGGNFETRFGLFKFTACHAVILRYSECNDTAKKKKKKHWFDWQNESRWWGFLTDDLNH